MAVPVTMEVGALAAPVAAPRREAAPGTNWAAASDPAAVAAAAAAGLAGRATAEPLAVHTEAAAAAAAAVDIGGGANAYGGVLIFTFNIAVRSFIFAPAII